MLRASRLHRISPFLLFVKRRHSHCMTFSKGQANTRHMGELWKRMSMKEKSRYQIEAHRMTLALSAAKNAHQRKNLTHQASDYNLVMKLLFAPPLGSFLSGEIAGQIAQNTVACLTDEGRHELRKSFGVADVVRERPWSKSEYEVEVQPKFVPTRYCDPSRFSSFTEMAERGLGVDQRQIYESVAIIKSGMRYTPTFAKTIASEWNLLRNSQLYNPISSAERKRFENFCATAALTGANENKIDIYTLFCQFRGLMPHSIQTKKSRSSRAVALLKSDRRHDVYERVLSTLSTLHSTRASDHARVVVQHKFLKPSSYAVVPFHNVQKIAEKIAEERVGCCVYDEVIARYGALMPNNAVAVSSARSVKHVSTTDNDE